jgi:hypothetical protein
MGLLLLEEMVKVINSINSHILMVSMLMINVFILLTGEIIVLLNGNLVQRMDKLLRGEMVQGIDWIN